MKGLRAEVGRCLTGLAVCDGQIVARFSFPSEFVGFAGHFPNDPVLPGVCFMEAVLVILESHFGKKVSLDRLISAKFLSAVRHGQECAWTCRISEQGDGVCRVKATINRQRERVAVVDLMVSLTNERPG